MASHESRPALVARRGLAACGLLALGLAASGCLGVARLSDLPASANDVDFAAHDGPQTPARRELRDGRPGQSFVVQSLAPLDGAALAEHAADTLREAGYEVVRQESEAGVVLAERGLRMNEWGSVTGVYFRPQAQHWWILVDVRITQDVTGSWREDRARKLATTLCGRIGGCEGI
ncbi:MAG: hypothetical protein H6748_18665 [Spirochaetaceae bacterium]|nr:hypothetical protein [Myxococcales bacterium]MCB9726080.1 hypothetical protein [Spirochaetaceae bacterium]